jgi:hypothetical protein
VIQCCGIDIAAARGQGVEQKGVGFGLHLRHDRFGEKEGKSLGWKGSTSILAVIAIVMALIGITAKTDAAGGFVPHRIRGFGRRFTRIVIAAKAHAPRLSAGLPRARRRGGRKIMIPVMTLVLFAVFVLAEFYATHLLIPEHFIFDGFYHIEMVRHSLMMPQGIKSTEHFMIMDI